MSNTYGMRISLPKAKVMGFDGCYPVRMKVVVEDYCLEQVRDFQYLDYNISWVLNRHVENKLSKFRSICGMIQRSLKIKLDQKSKLNFIRSWQYLHCKVMNSVKCGF